MTGRTRYFVIASLLVLTVGLGTGLVAYYVGLPGQLGRHAGPEELRYVPRDAAVLAYADVRELMTSELRRQFKSATASSGAGQQEFQQQTGINIESDVDRIVACLDPSPTSTPDTAPDQVGLVLARGRFDEVKIESLLTGHGARVETYKGKRLLVAEHLQSDRDRPGTAPDVVAPRQGGRAPFALVFVEPGLAAFGSVALVRSAIDLQAGGDNVTANGEMMEQVRAVDSGNAWAVGRFDAIRSRARLPEDVAGRLPAVTWFSVSGHVNGGLRGVLRASARDEQAANDLRDVIRGFLALAKLQTGARPELKAVADSLQLGGTGTTVSLAFDVPAGAFQLLGQSAPRRERDTRPR